MENSKAELIISGPYLIAHCSSPEIAFAERCPPVPKDLTGSGNESPSRMPETLNPFLAFSSEDLQGMDKVNTIQQTTVFLLEYLLVCY